MRGRSPEAPLTVINRFAVKGDTGRFERAFREHSRYLRGREGVGFLVTVRLVERPEVYVHIGYWRTTRGFLDTVHDGAFHSYVRTLGPLVDTEADQAESVARVLRENAAEGADGVVLTRARAVRDPAAFEALFAEATARFQRSGGFGGADLLRSTLRPDTYTGVHWWRGAADRERALGGEGHAALLDRMRATADIEVERARRVG